MAFTFSAETFTRPLGDFGNDSAQMILQTGQMITQGLQQMMTNRQIKGLGAELSSLNPESPDWAQKAIRLGSQYPLAMKSEAGQFMLGTQAKAHAEWRQVQQATQQSNLAFGRQVGLENLRTSNDIQLEGIRQKNRMELGGGGVDLSGVALPDSLDGGAPTDGISFGTDETQPQPQESVSGTPLTGMDGLLPDISGALGPLAAAQKITGVKPTRAQVAQAVAAERTRRQQEKMQEDRQRQQEVMAEKSRLASEAAADKRTQVSEQRADARLEVGAIKTELAGVERDIAAQRRAVNRVIEEQAKKKKLTEDDHAQRAQLQAELEALGAERTRLNDLLKQTSAAESSPTPSTGGVRKVRWNAAKGTFE